MKNAHIIDKRLICRNIHKLNMFSLRKIALIINVSHMTVKRWIEKDENDILKSHYDQINRKKLNHLHLLSKLLKI